MTQNSQSELPVSQSAHPDWLTILQVAFSGFFALVYLTVAIGSLGVSLTEIGRKTTLDTGSQLGYSAGIVSLILAGFNLSSTWFGARKLSQGDEAPSTENSQKWLNYLILSLPILLLAGAACFQSEELRIYVLPIITSLILLAGVVWLVRIGSGQAWGKNLTRNSGLFSLMSGFTVWFIMFLEMVAMMIFGIALLSKLAENPSWTQKITDLLALLQSNPDSSEVLQSLDGFVSVPTLIGIVFLMVAVLMPVIEELFKTLGVWIFSGRGLNPAEGWVAGLMSGAAFALMEGLLYGVQVSTLNVAQDWVVSVIGRTGGSVLHTLCGGLVGLAFAKTWKDKKPWRVIGSFVLVIFLHGLWNSLALLPTIFSFNDPTYSHNIVSALPLIGLMVLIMIWYTVKTKSVNNDPDLYN